MPWRMLPSMSEPPPYALRAVLFDRDDTLSRTDAGVYREAARWLHDHYGIEPKRGAREMLAQWASVMGKWEHLRTLEDEEAFWRGYAAELAHRLGLPLEAGQELLSEWPYWRFLRPVPGAREVLLELRARGLKVGVLSNTLPNVGVTLEAIGVADLVDVALATCTLGVHKPEARAFLLAAQALDLAPSEVLFVDDRRENVEAAGAVGMRALLIDHDAKLPGALHRLDALLGHLGAAQEARP